MGGAKAMHNAVKLIQEDPHRGIAELRKIAGKSPLQARETQSVDTVSEDDESRKKSKYKKAGAGARRLRTPMESQGSNV